MSSLTYGRHNLATTDLILSLDDPFIREAACWVYAKHNLRTEGESE